MASHFKWYPGSDDVTVPFNARFSFPSQANKSIKMTPRINPKTGANYSPGQQMRIELPAQGYMNAGNSCLEFDVTLAGWETSSGEITRFQNNIQSLFSRVRILYGSTPLEDIINYNVIIRALTEWTGTNQNGLTDQQSLGDGVGGYVVGSDSAGKAGLCSVRQTSIQGVTSVLNSTAYPAGTSFNVAGLGGAVPNNQSWLSGVNLATGTKCTRRYQVHLGTGLFTQEKLIPLKFMASAFAIEITFAPAEECIFSLPGASTGTPPTYAIGNVNFLPEILEFDASYDAVFLEGLRNGGIPILFASWHTYIFNTAASSNVNLLVQERSRSVKALFCVQRRSPIQMSTDSHATFFDTAAPDVSGTTMQSYQYRIGGRYYPPSPVQLSNTMGGKITNGGAEAYAELEKALNIVGDYRLSTSCNSSRWALPPASTVLSVGGVTATASYFHEYDYCSTQTGFTAVGVPVRTGVTRAAVGELGNVFAGTMASSCYASAISLETSNGMEISGLNAEEQSDISFIGNWSGGQASGFSFEVYSYYDSMIILRENNVCILCLLTCIGSRIDSMNKNVSVLIKMAFGLSDQYEYFELFLDSLDADSADGTALSTDFPLFQLGSPIPSVAAIKILEVQIPFSYYVFNERNNTFLLTDDVVANALVTIPVGNYNSGVMTTRLKAQLELASPNRVYTVVFSNSNPNTGKFTITNNAVGLATFSLIFGSDTDVGATNPRNALGFGAGANVSTLQTLVAPYAAILSGPNYLYVNCRALGPSINTQLPLGAVSLGGGSVGPQICKVPVTVQPGGVIFWTDPNPDMWFSLGNLALLSQLDLYITVGNTAQPPITEFNGGSISVKVGVLQNKMQSVSVQGASGSDRIFTKRARF